MRCMESAEKTIELADEPATEALGAAIAACLAPGAAVTLTGDLGAGKTTLARGAVRALLGQVEVPSPTFTLVQTYETPGFELWHADLYRIEHEDELDELGLEDAFEDAACLVEWPERLGPRLPERRLDVRLSFVEGGGRRAVLTAHGEFWVGRLEQI